MFTADYVKKEADLLDKIVTTLQKLDDSLSEMDATNTATERKKLQRDAMDEINRFLKQSGKLENLQGRKYAYDDYGTSADYARQNQALRDIESTCESLQSTLQNMDVNDVETREAEALAKTFLEIRQILRSIGRYDDYQEDERARIIDGV